MALVLPRDPLAVGQHRRERRYGGTESGDGVRMIDEPSFDVVLVKHTPEHPTITGESYRVVFTAEACEEMRREYPGALILTPGDIEQLALVPVEGRWAAVKC